MAVPPSPPPDLADAQRRHQVAIAAAAEATLIQAWPLFIPGDAAAFTHWLTVVQGIIARYGAAEARAASNFYQLSREGTPGTFRPQLAQPNRAQVTVSMRWATTPTDEETAAGGLDLAAAEQRMLSAAEKDIVDVGRMTLLEAQFSDKQAIGWVRVTRANPCAFCALLATRGPVYRSEESASFEAHNNCHCFPAPIFVGQKYVMPDHVTEWRAMYRTSTAGKSGDAARLAFRRAYEGRTAPKSKS